MLRLDTMTMGRRLCAALLCLPLAACADDGGSNTSDDGGDLANDRAEWAATIAEAVVVPEYTRFASQAADLEAAVRAWEQTGDDADLQLARDAWRTAMATWQRAELTQFGPAGAMTLVAGGEDLRDLIYSWPVVNPCRVDQETARAGYADGDGVGGFAINARGLDTLEYLLFAPSTDNACRPGSGVNRDGEWDALSEADIRARRAAYALAAAEQTRRDADDLVQWWSTDGRAFLDEVRTAGAGSDVYPSASEALNAITDALFYIEKETKDMKLATPLGLVGCDAEVCPESVENPWSGASLDHIRENTVAMQWLLHGGDPSGDDPGFDDWLRELGAADLADRMAADLDAVIVAIDAVNQPLETAVVEDRASVMAVHDALRVFVTDLKTQFVTTLDLEVPLRAEGDND